MGAIMVGKPKSFYSGALNQPFLLQRLGIWMPEAEMRAEIRRQTNAEWTIKRQLLLEHYGIETGPPKCWEVLAFCVALDHVPGMQVAFHSTKRGPRQKWLNVAHARELVRRIDNEHSHLKKIGAENHTIRHACVRVIDKARAKTKRPG